MKPIHIFSIIAILSITLVSCSVLKKQRESSSHSSPDSNSKMSSGNIEAIKELDHFPETRKGFDRFVIFPEPKESEETERLFRIEIIPGKTIMADCNRHSLMGSMVEKDLEGWGVPYYEFNSDGQMISTKMACPDYTPAEKFITGETKMIRYNSRLPVVVYVPRGLEVKFRIWKADEIQPASMHKTCP